MADPRRRDVIRHRSGGRPTDEPELRRPRDGGRRARTAGRSTGTPAGLGDAPPPDSLDEVIRVVGPAAPVGLAAPVPPVPPMQPIAPHAVEAAPAPADPMLLSLAVVAAVFVGGIVTVMTTVGIGQGRTPVVAAAILGALGLMAALLAVVARLNVEAFLLALLAVRPILDAADSGDGFAPSAAIGILFLAVSIVWLVVQWSGRHKVGSLPLSWAAGALLAAAALSTIFSLVPRASVVELARLSSVFVMYVVLERLARRPGVSKRLFLALYLSLPIPVLAALAQFAGLPIASPTIIDGLARVSGTLVHPSSLAMYLTFAILPGLALLPRFPMPQRIAVAALLALAGVALLFTYTRAAWIGLAVGLLVMAFLVRRRMGIAALVVVALLALTPPVQSRFADIVNPAETSAGGTEQRPDLDENSLAWRLGHWGEAWDLAEGHRVTGTGPRGVETLSTGNKSTHNDYLRSLVELGWLGLLAYLALLVRLGLVMVNALRRARTKWDRSVAVGFAGAFSALLVISLTDNLMSQSVVMWYFAITAAAASAVAASVTTAREPVPAGGSPEP